MEVSAKLKFSRIAPRKARIVIDVVRGMAVEQAMDQLKVMNMKAAGLVLKLLKSAIANAENNFSLQRSNLYIKKIIAGDGPILYRWMPKAMGRATPIRKKTTHIEIVLGEKVESKLVDKKKNPAKVSAKVSEAPNTVTPEKVKQTDEKVEDEQLQSHDKEIFDKAMVGKHRHNENLDKKNKKGKGFLKKVFQRKSV